MSANCAPNAPGSPPMWGFNPAPLGFGPEGDIFVLGTASTAFVAELPGTAPLGPGFVLTADSPILESFGTP